MHAVWWHEAHVEIKLLKNGLLEVELLKQCETVWRVHMWKPKVYINNIASGHCKNGDGQQAHAVAAGSTCRSHMFKTHHLRRHLGV